MVFCAATSAVESKGDGKMERKAAALAVKSGAEKHDGTAWPIVSMVTGANRPDGIAFAETERRARLGQFVFATARVKSEAKELQALADSL